MRVASVIVTAFLLAPFPNLSAQEPERETGGFDLSIQAVWWQRLDYGARESTPGINVGIAYRLPSGPAFELRGSYRTGGSETYVPMHFGVAYHLPISPIISLAPFAGFGPSVMVGNDWAGFFASYETGGRGYLSLGEDARIRATLEVSYGRAMAFHPSEFGMWNLAGGLSIEL